MAKEKYQVTIMPSLGKQITVTTGNKKILEALNKGRHDTAYNIYIADMKLEKRVGLKSAKELKERLKRTGDVDSVKKTLKVRGTKEYREKEISAIRKNVENVYLSTKNSNFNFFDYAEELRTLNNPTINRALSQIDNEVEKLASRYSSMEAYATMKNKVRDRLTTIVQELMRNQTDPKYQQLLGAIKPIESKVRLGDRNIADKDYKGNIKR